MARANANKTLFKESCGVRSVRHGGITPPPPPPPPTPAHRLQQEATQICRNAGARRGAVTKGYKANDRDQDLRSVVKALGRLVLRQEDSLSVMQLHEESRQGAGGECPRRVEHCSTALYTQWAATGATRRPRIPKNWDNRCGPLCSAPG